MAGRAHGEGSAAWLAARGYPELGPAIAGHPVTRLADAAWFDGWIDAASPEELIVAYADKRAGQSLEPMRARFESWERRYPRAERAARARGSWTAATLAEVRRLAWTAHAMAAARRAAAGARRA